MLDVLISTLLFGTFVASGLFVGLLISFVVITIWEYYYE